MSGCCVDVTCLLCGCLLCGCILSICGCKLLCWCKLHCLGHHCVDTVSCLCGRTMSVVWMQLVWMHVIWCRVGLCFLPANMCPLVLLYHCQWNKYGYSSLPVQGCTAYADCSLSVCIVTCAFRSYVVNWPTVRRKQRCTCTSTTPFWTKCTPTGRRKKRRSTSCRDTVSEAGCTDTEKNACMARLCGCCHIWHWNWLLLLAAFQQCWNHISNWETFLSSNWFLALPLWCRKQCWVAASGTKVILLGCWRAGGL